MTKVKQEEDCEVEEAAKGGCIFPPRAWAVRRPPDNSK
jgi:hypothetical protein